MTKNFKISLGTIGTVIAIMAALWGAMHIFCEETDSLARHEDAVAQAQMLVSQVKAEVSVLAAFSKAEFIDIRISTKRDLLYQLYKQYGTRDCMQMPQPAQADCLNLERDIKDLQEKKRK